MKTIKLSENSLKEYFLTGITKEQFTLIINRELDKVKSELDIDVKNIIKIGEKDKAKYSAITDYVGYFYGNNLGEGRKIHYRCYKYTITEQKEKAYLINMCEDKRQSALSAFNALPYKFLVLWQKEKTENI